MEMTTAVGRSDSLADALAASGTIIRKQIEMPDTGPWYRNSSGGCVVAPPGHWNAAMVILLFPASTSSPRVTRPVAAPSITHQLRHMQPALSINKSELARILRVSRPTIYEWLNGGEPKAANRTRIRKIAGLLERAEVSAGQSLFPHLVRSSGGSGDPSLLELLCAKTLNEDAIVQALRTARAAGDSIDAERAEREARQRTAGFDEVDATNRKSNLATNVALMDWPRG